MLATYGGAISDAWLAGTQYHVDLPDEVPYEAARTWGRARADQCLLGFRRVDGGWRLVWAAMSGAFEVNVLSAYLDECGGAIESTKDGLHTVNWWPGYEVDVATDHVVVRHESGVGEIGKWPAVVDEAIARRAAIAGELMASKDSPTVPWLLLGGEGVATVQMQPFALSVTSKLSVADATAFCKEQAARVLVADTAWAPGFESLRQLWPAALEAASVTAIQGSDRVRIEVTGKDLDPLLLWPLLQ